MPNKPRKRAHRTWLYKLLKTKDLLSSVCFHVINELSVIVKLELLLTSDGPRILSVDVIVNTLLPVLSTTS